MVWARRWTGLGRGRDDNAGLKAQGMTPTGVHFFVDDMSAVSNECHHDWKLRTDLGELAVIW